MTYTISFKSKWADFDANRHMRHTAYNDYAAECRIAYFTSCGLSPEYFETENFGPILFEENTRFYREINMGESLMVDLSLKGTSKNAERFKMLHRIYKENGIVAAEIVVYIAWIDLTERKLIKPPKNAIKMLGKLDKTDNFEEIHLKRS